MEKSRVEEVIGESVTEFKVSPGCKNGDGMAGKLTSIYAKTTSGKELRLVLKEVDKSSPMGGEQAEGGSFKTENMVYSKLIPKLTEFAKSRGVEVQIPVPKIQSTYQGTETLDDYICMEDVRYQDYKMTDKYAGLSLDEMLIVMTELARFHALGHALIRWEGEKIFTESLATLVEFFSVDTFAEEIHHPKFESFYSILQGGLQIAAEVLEGRNPKLHEKLKKHVEKISGPKINRDELYGISTGTDFKYFPVIVHGDAWQNNFMFKYDKNGVPTSVKFLDFQFTRRGNLYEDLLYTVHTSTTPEFRRLYLSTILQKYYDSFTSLLKQLKIHRPIGFTFGSFLDTFRENTIFCYRYMTFAIPLQLGTSIPDVMAMMMQQNPGMPPPADPTPEEKMQMFMGIMRVQINTSPRAIDRLEALTQEMVDLSIL